MQRKLIVALLKELLELNLVSPSIVSIDKNEGGNFDLLMKADGDAEALEQFIDEKNLVLKINSENCYSILSKQ